MTGFKTVSYRRIKFVALSTLSLTVLMGVPAFCLGAEVPGMSLHGQITHDALGGVLAEANIKAVVDADDSQDRNEGAADKRRHFDGGSLPSSLAYINREKTTALNMGAEGDSDPQSRADALRHFGLMIHCVQDFYLRSNYVELQLQDTQNREAPYDIALVDWSKLPTTLAAAKNGDDNDPLNKESPVSEVGKKCVFGKITMFKVARELAVRETQRQWNLFETLLRSRCGDRSTAVLAALRQAPPEGYAGKESPEIPDYR